MHYNGWTMSQRVYFRKGSGSWIPGEIHQMDKAYLIVTRENHIFRSNRRDIRVREVELNVGIVPAVGKSYLKMKCHLIFENVRRVACNLSRRIRQTAVSRTHTLCQGFVVGFTKPQGLCTD